ncbi:BLUF domain-containing protein [Shewanella sp. SP2S2-4]|uniref:BLUF domain-containing protein n=1 Tax=Shewanella TaxID=22 RepID=UPI00288C9E3B|nr:MULTISPECIES: BLUF domain-containing protein [unclassified Shewanella]MDT3275288.1 BLUF domain-containing protein [Shewanella sp. SP2S2-4]MDT3337303.1 BLUF domain-containing protein [Shewanella sp. SP1S1-7]
MLFELLYTSIAPAGLSETELLSILEKARAKNKASGITGMLVYHNREIMQILEGEELNVRALFQTIFKDERHTSVEVFYQGNIDHRAFSEWSMAFKVLDENTVRKMLIGYENFNPEKSPISMIADSPNRGKRTFLKMRDSL